MSERILIVSDTHGRLNYFKEMLARTGKPDRLIHLGDSEGQQETNVAPREISCC